MMRHGMEEGDFHTLSQTYWKQQTRIHVLFCMLTVSLIQVINPGMVHLVLAAQLYRDKGNPAIVFSEQRILISSPSGRKKAEINCEGLSFCAVLPSLQPSNVLAFMGIKPSLTMMEKKNCWWRGRRLKWGSDERDKTVKMRCVCVYVCEREMAEQLYICVFVLVSNILYPELLNCFDCVTKQNEKKEKETWTFFVSVACYIHYALMAQIMMPWLLAAFCSVLCQDDPTLLQ